MTQIRLCVFWAWTLVILHGIVPPREMRRLFAVVSVQWNVGSRVLHLFLRLTIVDGV